MTPETHPFIGNFGHFSVILSFVAAMVAAYAYLRATLLKTNPEATLWNKYGKIAFYVHGLAVFCVVVALYGIIRGHYFEYHYAFSHSSKSLPAYYMISCFWEGQEGSFLLWIFWHVVLGFILLNRKTAFQSPVMAIFAAVQAFLCSMILGVVLFDSLKIGSSPFLTLREALPNLPVWQMNPDFIPKDGNGLNPLLQNYWMVIHPPTLFLGFALTVVPFVFCIAGLWRGQFREWIKPALPWALVSTLVLGVGILMGAYWAYETLNFGGYWNWDPVENAIYVPWLVMVAGVHTMIIHPNNASALKTSIILVISQFILILYSTFLTRSGILGNASVHSFTDLGLSGQLLLYLLFFVAVSIYFCVRIWKKLPSDEKEVSTYSREFWLFCGTTVLCLAAFQVIATTSIPVYNAIMESFGYVSKLALPVDQIGHYTKFQLWFFVCVAILSGIGQYVWWRRIKPQEQTEKWSFGAWEALSTPLMATFICTALLIAVAKVNNWIYIVLLTAVLFSFITNGSIIWALLRKRQFQLSGGAVTHIGVALMLIGILFSAGYSKVISLNTTGLLISKAEAFTANGNKENLENVMLWLNKPTRMGQYLLTYKGQRIEARELKNYLKREDVEMLPNDFKGIALKDLSENGSVQYKKGDTLALYPENTFYEVEYREPSGQIFTLYPRAQINPKMGTLASPDIKKNWKADIYTHVSYVNDPNEESDWSKPEVHTVALQDTFFVNDYVAVLDKVGLDTNNSEAKTSEGEAAIKASIKVLDKDQTVEINPVFVMNTQTGMVKRKPLIDKALGLKIRFDQIDPKAGLFSFTVNTTQRDFIVMKALEKPLINLLWIGTGVLVIGLLMAIFKKR